MKKILLMFLIGTMTMFSQTIKVKGVTLSYDKVKKIMTLKINMTNQLFILNNNYKSIYYLINIYNL